ANALRHHRCKLIAGDGLAREIRLAVSPRRQLSWSLGGREPRNPDGRTIRSRYDPYRPVRAPRDDAFAVRAEGYAKGCAHVPLEGKGLLSGLGVPHLHRLIRAAGGDALAVATEGHAPHNVGMPP